LIPSSLIPDLRALDTVSTLYETLATLAAIFVIALCGVFWKLADVMDAAARWIEHDLRMRRGK
jgi:uncharacterized membrane protein YqjE